MPRGDGDPQGVLQPDVRGLHHRPPALDLRGEMLGQRVRRQQHGRAAFLLQSRIHVGQASALLISALSRATTMPACRAGAAMPYHWSASKPG